MTKPHALYRFFDSEGGLLYVGITLDPGARWKQHRDDKPWWSEIATVTVESHADRVSVLMAEKAAIITERPRYNVVYNRGVTRVAVSAPAPEAAPPPAHQPYDSSVNLWTYRNRRSDYQRTSDLYLAWEVDGTAISDDYTPDEIDALALLQLWARRYANRRHARILWTISPPHEMAPFQTGFNVGDDFLTHFTHPVNVHTGEDLNFNRLPIVDGEWGHDGDTKGGFFQAATGWRPAPLQGQVDLLSVFNAAGISSRYIQENR